MSSTKQKKKKPVVSNSDDLRVLSMRVQALEEALEKIVSIAKNNTMVVTQGFGSLEQRSITCMRVANDAAKGCLRKDANGELDVEWYYIQSAAVVDLVNSFNAAAAVASATVEETSVLADDAEVVYGGDYGGDHEK